MVEEETEEVGRAGVAMAVVGLAVAIEFRL